MLALTQSDIRKAVSRKAFDDGQEYQLDGRVRRVQARPGSPVIEAAVQGTRDVPYRQTIRVTRTRTGACFVTGSCTCPMSFNCKHVAAALIAYADTAGGSLPPGDDSPSQGAPLAPAEAPLPYAVDAWLRDLEQARDEASQDDPPTIRKRLFYVLRAEPNPVTGKPAAQIGLATVELRKDGTSKSTGRQCSLQQLLGSGLPSQFVRPSDRALLRRLGHAGVDLAHASAEEAADLLRRIVATGRGRWSGAQGPVLSLGPAEPGTLGWRVLEDASQRPELTLGPDLVALPFAECWYVNRTTGVLGKVALDLEPQIARALLAAPPVPASLAPRICAELARRVPGIAIPPPRAFADVEILRGPPTPRLRLLGRPRPDAAPGKIAQGEMAQPVARLSFGYGPPEAPVEVAAFDRRSEFLRDGRLYRVERDAAREQAARDQIGGLGLRTDGFPGHAWGGGNPRADDLLMAHPDDGGDWLDFLLDDVADLRRSGWEVVIEDDFPIRIVGASGPIEATIADGSGIDWFQLDLGVMLDDGERVDLIPPLLDLIGQADRHTLARAADLVEAGDEPVLVPLPDGRLLTLPMARIQPILSVLLELSGAGGLEAREARLGIGRAGVADLARLEAAGLEVGMVWHGGEALRALGRMLRERGGIPAAAVPAAFAATLRPYQQRGVDWLQFLRDAGLGGMLADDMGLGKTVQALAHLAIEQAAGRLRQPALVVCPTSLVANWQGEAARFAPFLRVLTLHGPDRRKRFPAIAAHDLVITTYPLLFRDHAALTAQEWHVVVLDEAQTIKNPVATTSMLARKLRAGQRLCLSGTPMENHLGELWSLFDFLMPRFLGDKQAFGRRFRGPIEKGGDVGRRDILARRVAPFLLRRTKEEVAADLPDKTEITEAVELGAEQRAVYEGIRLAMHAKVRAAIAERGLARSGIIILDALLKLRQACCDPRLLKLHAAPAATAGSAKLDRLMEMLPPLLEEGRRVLLFSQFTSMLALIRTALDAAKLPYLLLTGQSRDRAATVARFQAGEVPLFLISLKAGGTGLNLTAADTVIHYDPWWNPAVENQATDRAHRIGQTRAVFVHRLVTLGTIEAKMEELKARKRALVAGILSAERGSALTMTEADVEMLFEPAAR